MRRRLRGFTLVEAVIAVGIVVIVASLAALGVSRSRDAGRESDVQRVLVELVQAQDRYAMRHNAFATSTAQLQEVGWSASASIEARILDVSSVSYCAEAWWAGDSGVIASVRSGEVVQGVSCAERVVSAGGVLDGEPDPSGQLSVSELVFGRVRLGEVATLEFTIVNGGGGVLVGGASASAPFTVLSGGSYELAAGESVVVVVRFEPLLEDEFEAEVVLSGRNTANVPVRGAGFVPPMVGVDPSELVFGTLAVGETEVRSFTLRNDGGDPLVGVVTAPAGFEVVSGATYDLERDASQTVTVRFAPNASQAWDAQVSLSGGVDPASVRVRGVSHWPPDPEVTPSSRNFGTVEVGSSATQSVNVRNRGEGTLVGAASVTGPFSVVSGGSYSLAAGQSQSVTLRFEPLEVGAQSGALTLSGGGGAVVSLTGRGRAAPEVGVSPTSLVFASVETGSSSTLSVTVTNVGDGVLSGVASVSAPFEIVSGASYSLEANESQAVVVRFSSESSGSWSDAVSFTGGSGASVPVSASAHPPPSLEVTPSALAFGLVPIHGSATRSFTVRNAGGGVLSGSASVSVAGVSVVSGGSYSLAAGQSQSVSVRWSPTTLAALSGSVTLSGAAGGSVSLSGTVDPEPVLSVTPGVLGFGEVLLGEDRTLSVSVTNAGGGRLVGSASAGGPFSVVGGGSYDLAAGESQVIEVRFAPVVRGEVGGTLSASGGGGGAVVLSGRGLAPGELSVSPSSLVFEMIEVGSVVTGSVTLTNVGDVSVSGSASVSSPFTVSAGASYSIAAGDSHSVTVRFAPESVGSWSRALSLTGGGGASVSVVGSSFVPAAFTVTPASVSFPDTLVGASSDAVVTVTNVGSVSGTASVSVAAPFSVVGTSSFSLAGGASRSVTVRFEPLSGGAVSGSVSVSGGPEVVSASLAGVGLLPAQISVSLESWDAGAVQVGSSVVRDVLVSNEGGVVLSGIVSVSGDVEVASGGSYSIAPGGSHTVTLRFEPQAWGARSGTAVFSGGGDASVSVSGNGVARMSASALVFSDQTVDTRSSYQNVRIYNDAPVETLIGSASVSGPFEIHASYVHYSIAPGGWRDVIVRFYPRAAGPFMGELVLSGTGAAPLPLTGTGVLPPTLHVSPTVFTWPATQVGEQRTQSFTITNVGGGVMTGTYGGDAFMNLQTIPSGSFSLGPNESTSFTVTWHPPAAHLTWAASVTADVDAGAAGSQEITLVTGDITWLNDWGLEPRRTGNTRVTLWPSTPGTSFRSIDVWERAIGSTGNGTRIWQTNMSGGDGTSTNFSRTAGSIVSLEWRTCLRNSTVTCGEWTSVP